MQQFTAEERVRWMDRFGIERSVLSFPSVSLYLGDEREVERPVERKEVCRFLNDLFAETHAKQPKRLHFFADVPLAVDVEFSCKELHRAVDDLGLQGIAIQSNLGGRLPSEPQFEEFFAEAAKMGVPIFMHPHAPYGREKMMKYWVFAIVGFIVANVLGNVVAAVSNPAEADKNDERDREIDHIGERVGNWLIIAGSIAALVLAMTRADHFWIANAIFLGGIAGALLSSATKIAAYHGSFQRW